jgi:hypothetical protein
MKKLLKLGFSLLLVLVMMFSVTAGCAPLNGDDENGQEEEED